tara:strand:- start:183 stop:395 length:213 start_codon:yes stop_codon:yes gene_type:complete
MKKVDILAAVLLVVGGLNWGLVGAFNFDLVAAIFGKMSTLSKVVYILVGLATLHQGLGIKGIKQRWGVQN